jgi:hypothetical protein
MSAHSGQASGSGDPDEFDDNVVAVPELVVPALIRELDHITRVRQGMGEWTILDLLAANVAWEAH